MTPLESVLVALAGVAAGTINTVVGSGTLITFPTLLAFGVPPVTANVSNNIGLVPGSVTGAIGYRDELRGQRHRVLRLLSASVAGGAVGAVLLLVLPEGAFESIVPVLIMLGVLLMGVLGIGVAQSLQRSNAVKNVLAAAVNGVAGVIFAFVADVDWRIVALIGAGSVVGGLIGSRIGKRLPPLVLRVVIVVVGLTAFVTIVVS